jgi:Male sterility protein
MGRVSLHRAMRAVGSAWLASVWFVARRSVRFTNQPHKPCCLHAQATAEVLALAEALPQLRAFVHVSTAFVNGHQPQVRWVLGRVALCQRPGLACSSSSTCH